MTLPADTTTSANGDAQALPNRIKVLLATLGGLAVAVITLLTAFNVVNWSPSQTALVTAECAAAVALLTACTAHLWPHSRQEWVAIGGTATALVGATLALLNGFDVWTLTPAQISALTAVVTAAMAVGSALFVREKVTADPEGSERGFAKVAQGMLLKLADVQPGSTNAPTAH